MKEYDMKKALTWADIRRIGKSDKAGRWYPAPNVAEYFSGIRSPSRAWPWSYAKAAQTAKFARWLTEHQPAIAQQLLTK
jgi:hypothetical protein